MAKEFQERVEHATRRLAEMLTEASEPGWYGEVALTAKIVNGRIECLICRPEQHERFAAGRN